MSTSREQRIAAAKDAVIEAARELLHKGASEYLMGRVRELEAAEREPEPRYSCPDGDKEDSVIRDGRTGLWITVGDAVDRLNESESRLAREKT